MTFITFVVTAYCACALCTGHTHGITKSGRPATVNRTIACPPHMMHKVVWLDGIGARVCEDTGSKIKGKRIDLYVQTHDEALKFGKKIVKVRVY